MGEGKKNVFRCWLVVPPAEQNPGYGPVVGPELKYILLGAARLFYSERRGPRGGRGRKKKMFSGAGWWCPLRNRILDTGLSKSVPNLNIFYSGPPGYFTRKGEGPGEGGGGKKKCFQVLVGGAPCGTESWIRACLSRSRT